ncbi:5776df0b-6640-4c6c-ab2c-1b318b9c1012 [Sclerotinia trifoliorum]|uniref:5776df0b-6640-4c6c-ab2c-1b318b9c1012 n=1 Tax=Sclerotinia trifoliorum TaxID=28548 RepID=A0A8H2VR89_9HELO|nr:5776df0b-6640-4c6c-ab2c-1b318b9c1012 [Sclerotinia trifoliorum]
MHAWTTIYSIQCCEPISHPFIEYSNVPPANNYREPQTFVWSPAAVEMRAEHSYINHTQYTSIPTRDSHSASFFLIKKSPDKRHHKPKKFHFTPQLHQLRQPCYQSYSKTTQNKPSPRHTDKDQRPKTKDQRQIPKIHSPLYFRKYLLRTYYQTHITTSNRPLKNDRLV